MIVDDDAAIRALLVDVLRAEGYAVNAASDGLDVLKELARVHDLIVLDLMMPGVDRRAFAAARHGRIAWPEGPDSVDVGVAETLANSRTNAEIQRAWIHVQAIRQRDPCGRSVPAHGASTGAGGHQIVGKTMQGASARRPVVRRTLHPDL